MQLFLSPAQLPLVGGAGVGSKGPERALGTGWGRLQKEACWHNFPSTCPQGCRLQPFLHQETQLTASEAQRRLPLPPMPAQHGRDPGGTGWASRASPSSCPTPATLWTETQFLAC